MSTLKQVREGFVATVQPILVAEAQVYQYIPAHPVLPCLCIVPATADFAVSMGRGTDTWVFDLTMLVPSGNEELAQQLLDEFVTGAGPTSVRQALFQNRTLGLADVDAHIAGMTNYGGSIEAVGVDHVGASLRLVVHTSGKS